MGIISNIIGRIASNRVKELEEELTDRRDEIDLLETELAAAKAAHRAEEKEADFYATELHAADGAIAMLYELTKDKLEPADDVRFDTIARSLKRRTNKGHQSLVTTLTSA